MRGFGKTNKEGWILQEVQKDRRVLHIGCTNAPNLRSRLDNNTLLHSKILQKNGGAVGLDIDEEGLALLRQVYPDGTFIEADANNLISSLNGEKYEVIVCGDIIEHLDQPGKMLSDCRQLLANDGKILISTVNAFSIVRFLKATLNHEAVHLEHTAYYSPKTLERLAALNGLKVTTHGYYEAEIEPKMNANRRISGAIEKVATAVFPQFSEGVLATMEISALPTETKPGQ